MPNVCLAAGLRLTVLFSLLVMGVGSASGQGTYSNPYDASMGRSLVVPGWVPRTVEDSIPMFPPAPRFATGGPATVSADVLRHPLSAKALRLFEKAMHHAELGNHAAAIQGLQEAVARYPSSAPYADNLLGLEYIETKRFQDAKDSFEEAARLMPHESANHSNFGLSLAIVGDLDSAEKEIRRAIQLDRSNSKAKLILEVLQSIRPARNKGASASRSKP